MNSDNFAVRAVVITACLLVLVIYSIIGAAALLGITVAETLVDVLDGTGKLALGGALGLLAKTSTSSEPAPVQVMNEGAAEAVPTEPTKGK